MLPLQFLRKTDPDAQAFWFGYLVLLPLFIAPLLVTRFLPGLDSPFHLAMADMLAKGGSPADPYRELYQGHLGLEPYAVHYMLLGLLRGPVSLMTAQKIIVGLYIAALPQALAALLRAAQRSCLPALLAFPLAYNLTLHYGFISFALSLPMLLLLLAAVGRFLLADEVKLPWAVAIALAAMALFLCHLQNFLFGLCATVALVLFSSVPWKRRLMALAAFVPSIGLLLHWHLTAEFEVGVERKTAAFAWQSLRFERLVDIGGRPLLQDFAGRFRDLPFHLLRGFTDEIDVMGSRALLLLLVMFFLAGLLGLALPRIDGPRARLRTAGVIVFAGALVAYLGLPHHLRAYELMTFYPRFSVLLVLTGTLLIPGALRRIDGVGRLLLLVPPMLFCGLYGRQLIDHYRYYDKEVADFDAVLDKTPPGGRALGLVYDRTSRVMRIESAMVGLPSLYAALHPNPAAMVPIFYCGMRHMPCRRTEKGRLIPDPGPWGASGLSPGAAVDFFDYFFVRLPPGRPIFGAELKRLDLIAQEGTWLVYGKKRAAAPADAPRSPSPSPSASARP